MWARIPLSPILLPRDLFKGYSSSGEWNSWQLAKSKPSRLGQNRSCRPGLISSHGTRKSFQDKFDHNDHHVEQTVLEAPLMQRTTMITTPPIV